jgi:hypothetical protein
MTEIITIIWLECGCIMTLLLIVLITEGGKRPLGFKPPAFILTTVAWPIAISVMIILLLERKKQKKERKHYPKKYFYY